MAGRNGRVSTRRTGFARKSCRMMVVRRVPTADPGSWLPSRARTSTDFSDPQCRVASPMTASGQTRADFRAVAGPEFLLFNRPPYVTNNHTLTERIRTGTSLCSRFSVNTKAPSDFKPSTARSALRRPHLVNGNPQNTDPKIRQVVQRLARLGLVDHVGKGSLGGCAKNDSRLVNTGESRGDPTRTGAETGRWRRVGWSSAARSRFVRLGVLGMDASSVGAVSRPRCSNRTLLRLAGFSMSTHQIHKASPPASGGASAHDPARHARPQGRACPARNPKDAAEQPFARHADRDRRAHRAPRILASVRSPDGGSPLRG